MFFQHFKFFFQKESLLTYLLTYLLTVLLTYLLTYLLIYFLTYLLIYLLTYFFTCLLNYLLNYLLTYLLWYLEIDAKITAISTSNTSNQVPFHKTGGEDPTLTFSWVLRMIFPSVIEIQPSLYLCVVSDLNTGILGQDAPMTFLTPWHSPSVWMLHKNMSLSSSVDPILGVLY